MCGRFAFISNNASPLESLHLPAPLFYEHYNLVPSQYIPAINISPETRKPDYTLLRWGLLPYWSKSATTKFPMINARAEGIGEKPSFRGPFRHHRCLIPCSGFYEWKKSNKGKEPFFIKPARGGIFLLAGIWDHWQDGEIFIESCAIITTTANSMVADIHDRMPVILPEERIATWLDTATGQKELSAMLQPCSSQLMETYPVSTLVNNARNNSPECMERLAGQQQLSLF